MKNWNLDETRELFNKVYEATEKGQGLKKVFSDFAQKYGKSLNSIRNYYYNQSKTFQLVPKIANELGIKLIGARREEFITFKRDEIYSLVENVLIKKAEGKSIRKIIFDYANQDPVLALRYMNKYRSVIVTHKELVKEIMNKLNSKNVVYYNPYIKEVVSGKVDDRQKLEKYLDKLSGADVEKFIEMLSKLVL